MLGRAELDTLLSERDRLNDELQRIIDEQTEPWGIKVTTVEIKDVEIPQTMQRAMARQAEAERERRAKIIAAEGEFQAVGQAGQAAAVIGAEPVAIQLRYLQTLARDRLGAQLDHDLPAADRSDHAVPGEHASKRGNPRARWRRPSCGSTRSRVCGWCWPRRGRTGRSASSPPTTHDAAREECPLCEGHESWTPPETYALRPGGGPPDSPGWLVRAVPNKYPLLEPGTQTRRGRRPDSGRGDPDLFVTLQGHGPPRGDRALARARRLDDRAGRRRSSATRSRAGGSDPPHTPTPPTCT